MLWAIWTQGCRLYCENVWCEHFWQNQISKTIWHGPNMLRVFLIGPNCKDLLVWIDHTSHLLVKSFQSPLKWNNSSVLLCLLWHWYLKSTEYLFHKMSLKGLYDVSTWLHSGYAFLAGTPWMTTFWFLDEAVCPAASNYKVTLCLERNVLANIISNFSAFTPTTKEFRKISMLSLNILSLHGVKLRLFHCLKREITWFYPEKPLPYLENGDKDPSVLVLLFSLTFCLR